MFLYQICNFINKYFISFLKFKTTQASHQNRNHWSCLLHYSNMYENTSRSIGLSKHMDSNGFPDLCNWYIEAGMHRNCSEYINMWGNASGMRLSHKGDLHTLDIHCTRVLFFRPSFLLVVMITMQTVWHKKIDSRQEQRQCVIGRRPYPCLDNKKA